MNHFVMEFGGIEMIKPIHFLFHFVTRIMLYLVLELQSFENRKGLKLVYIIL